MYPSPHQDMGEITIDQRGALTSLSNVLLQKGTGPDEIPSFVLKAVAHWHRPSRDSPFRLERCYGCPNLQERGKTHNSYYRPVSLTSVTCKIEKHIVQSSIMTYFDEFKIQHEFCKKRSCDTQLLVTIHNIVKHLSRGNQVDIICLVLQNPLTRFPMQGSCTSSTIRESNEV